MPRPKKRGRKPGVKIGPYKMTISEMTNRLKEIDKRLTKLEKVMS